MTDPLPAWRETLRDLGVMGLIPEPQPQAPLAAASPAPVAAAIRASLPSTATVASFQAGFCPSPQTVAEAPSLEALEAAISNCMACPLGERRVRFVFGEGAPRADLMFIGEGPGKDEDLQGRPFVGKAGELLDKMIEAIGLKRGDIYIANIVKCRPPDNRTPTAEEARSCLGYLRRQIELVQPKVIVTLGATPLRELLGITTGITRIRGQWQRYEGLPVMPTFHPAYVLRQYTQEVRRAVWEDLKAAKVWVDGVNSPGTR